MPRNKQPIHKTVIHPNRWFIWAIAISVIAGMALVGYIKVTSQAFEDDVTYTPHAANNWKQYTQTEQNFSVNVPPNWLVKEAGGVVLLTPKADSSEFISITPKPGSKEAAARASLDGFTQNQLIVGGLPASMFYSGQENDRYVLVKNNDKLFVVKSNSKQMERILTTLVFIK